MVGQVGFNMLRHRLLFLLFFIVSPVFRGQQVFYRPQAKQLEWRIEQQPVTKSCSEADLAFASAPEQIALAQSYGAPFHPGMKCESISAPAFHGARVLRIWKPSVYDDGYGYTLIQPKDASTTRLIFNGGGDIRHTGHENDEANRAAMNAMLQTSDTEDFEKADWLAISLAYLTILGEEPSLKDRSYAPGPNQNFQSYTVPGLLSELPTLARKHQVPTVECGPYWCTVLFYYRTGPVAPLEKCAFEFVSLDGKIRITSARLVDDSRDSSKKKRTNIK